MQTCWFRRLCTTRIDCDSSFRVHRTYPPNWHPGSCRFSTEGVVGSSWLGDSEQSHIQAGTVWKWTSSSLFLSLSLESEGQTRPPGVISFPISISKVDENHSSAARQFTATHHGTNPGEFSQRGGSSPPHSVTTSSSRGHPLEAEHGVCNVQTSTLASTAPYQRCWG